MRGIKTSYMDIKREVESRSFSDFVKPVFDKANSMYWMVQGAVTVAGSWILSTAGFTEKDYYRHSITPETCQKAGISRREIFEIYKPNSFYFFKPGMPEKFGRHMIYSGGDYFSNIYIGISAGNIKHACAKFIDMSESEFVPAKYKGRHRKSAGLRIEGLQEHKALVLVQSNYVDRPLYDFIISMMEISGVERNPNILPCDYFTPFWYALGPEKIMEEFRKYYVYMDFNSDSQILTEQKENDTKFLDLLKWSLDF